MIFFISIKISRRFVPEDLIDNNLALAPHRLQSIIWTNAGPIHRRIYAALGGDELKYIQKWPLVLPLRWYALSENINIS